MADRQWFWFIGPWNARKDIAFTMVIVSVQGQWHRTTPASATIYQSDVEMVHQLIEDECYQMAVFYSRKSFLKKAIS